MSYAELAEILNRTSNTSIIVMDGVRRQPCYAAEARPQLPAVASRRVCNS